MSLALLSVLAAAAAGSATAAPIPGAAGLADLAAVLQRGAGVCPLQAVVLQELGLKCSQVLLATLDLCSQQHDVGAVTRFLQQMEDLGTVCWKEPQLSSVLSSSSPQTPDTRLAGGTPPAHDLSPCGQEGRSATQPVRWTMF